MQVRIKKYGIREEIERRLQAIISAKEYDYYSLQQGSQDLYILTFYVELLITTTKKLKSTRISIAYYSGIYNKNS
ncbi:hypothetical protein [Wolbachia endosymbiont of Tettigetta isshikii]|uniref:hypothetical protein n=1 Tax=Wolbachia endosymbiont of Tettigetta isshikii TaxID=3239093 RepID=UPI0039805338